jgi:hypothetical protein
MQLLHLVFLELFLSLAQRISQLDETNVEPLFQTKRYLSPRISLIMDNL